MGLYPRHLLKDVHLFDLFEFEIYVGVPPKCAVEFQKAPDKSVTFGLEDHSQKRIYILSQSVNGRQVKPQHKLSQDLIKSVDLLFVFAFHIEAPRCARPGITHGWISGLLV
jgi:hypothetical protein